MTLLNDLASASFLILIILASILWYKFSYPSSLNGAPLLPPGPRGLPIVGYLPFLSHELHKMFTNMANIYGPIFKLQVGSNLNVVVNTVELAKVVLRDEDETFANRKPPIAAAATTFGGQDIVWSNNNSHWRNLRKILVHEVFNNKILTNSQAYRTQAVRKMIKNVYAKMGTEVNINEVSSSTEADLLTRITWENTSAKVTEDFVSDVRKISSGFVDLISQPNVSDLFPSLAWFDLQGVERKMNKLVKHLDRVFTSIIDDRLKSKSKISKEAVENEEKKDLLQILLELKDAASLDMNQIKALLVNIMIAGTETSSTIIEWAIAEVMQDHNIMERVQEELVEVVGLNNIVEEYHLSKLQYLDAVIKEVVRLHPVVPFLIPRSPNKSCAVGGYTVPKGCRVLVNVWAIHRDPRHWNNPLEFNPERFLTNKFDYKGNNLSFIPFGAGRRLCPGVPLAEKMLKFILASLLHSFDWSLPKGKRHDLSDKFGIVLRKRNPLMAIPTQRLDNMKLYM